MPVTPLVTPEEAPEGVQKVYGRIADTIGNGEVPKGYQLMGNVEAFCQDSYMNYKKFIHEGSDKLDKKQIKAIVIATSSAMNCVHCVRHHAKDAVATETLTEQEVAEVLAVTATCAMYNTYYRFKHLAGDSAFAETKGLLRAHTFQKTSLGDELTELINIVVSNINVCEQCTSGHVKKAMQLGFTVEQIDEAIRISATMASFNTFHRTQ